MICRICGRLPCTESFHSVEEQEQYEDIDGKLVKKEIEQEKGLGNMKKKNLSLDFMLKEIS